MSAFTTEQAAAVCGITPDTIWRWCRQGRLKSSKIGDEYRISRRELALFRKEQRGGDLFRAYLVPMRIKHLAVTCALDAIAALEEDPIDSDGKNLLPAVPGASDYDYLQQYLEREADGEEMELFFESYQETIEKMKIIFIARWGAINDLALEPYHETKDPDWTYLEKKLGRATNGTERELYAQFHKNYYSGDVKENNKLVDE